MENANASGFKGNLVEASEVRTTDGPAISLSNVWTTMKRYTRVFSIIRKAGENPVLPTGPYRREITAQDKAEFWFHTLMGR